MGVVRGEDTSLCVKPLSYQSGIRQSLKAEKARYEESCVHINDDQYFEGIEPEDWEYQIGGYQVCAKWLKDRKGRKLSLEEIKHYCKVVTALEKTISIQNEIDKLYPKIEENVIDFQDNSR